MEKNISSLRNNQNVGDGITNYLEAIIDNVPHSIFWKDANSVFLGCNKTFAKFAGLDNPKEIVGKTDYDLPWTKEESDAYRADDRKVITSGKPKLDIEEPQTLKDGTNIVLLTSKVPLINENNEVVGVLCIYSDITERKSHELALRKASQEISEIHKKNSEFLSIASHEIRGAVGSFIPLLEIVNREIQRLSSLIPDKSSFSCSSTLELIEEASTSFKWTLESINCLIKLSSLDISGAKKETINTTIAEIIKTQKSKYRENEKQIKVLFKSEADENKSIKIDHYHLDEILEILIKNAIKYSNDGGEIEVHFKLLKKSEGDFLVSSVKDSGAGISHDHLENLFSPLLDSHIKSSKFSKPSMRLCYIKKMLELLGGTVDVKSKAGKGTEVTFCFPYELNDINVAKNEKILDKKKNKGRLKILLVEDHALTGKLEKGMLESLGHFVDVAENGTSAIMLAKKGQYDVIFMDITLPDMNGIEVKQKLDALLGKGIMEFVAVTSHAIDKDVDLFYDEGFAAVLIKPVALDDFVSTIDVLINLED